MNGFNDTAIFGTAMCIGLYVTFIPSSFVGHQNLKIDSYNYNKYSKDSIWNQNCKIRKIHSKRQIRIINQND